MRFQCPAVSARLLRSRSASASERAPIACLRIRMRSHSTSVRSEATTRSSALAPLLVEKPLELGGLEPPRHAPVESWVVAGPKRDRKSTRLNSSHLVISYAVFCLKKKKKTKQYK